MVVDGRMRDRISWLLALAGVATLGFAALKPRTPYHPVTPSMQTTAGTMAGLRVPAVEAAGTDGKAHSPATESAGRPLVVFFIQDGCPCSEAADPYFRKLQEAYGRDVAFLGVIGSDLATARDWQAQH